MKTPFKFQIFIASLLLWIVANPTSAQQIRSLHEQFLHPSEEAKTLDVLVLDVWCRIKRRDYCRFGGYEASWAGRYVSDAD